MILFIDLQLHPKSENLSDMVRDIVLGLEHRFDSVAEKMATTPGLGTSWKDAALSSTLGEIPRIPISGTETGQTIGFGKFIYESPKNIDMAKTVSLQF